MTHLKRVVPPDPLESETEPPSAGCDRLHPPVLGERPTMDLGSTELFILAGLRTWVAPLRAPGASHPDWREIMRLGGVSGATALAFHQLMSAIAHTARRSLDVRCPACPSLGADEEAMLALVASLQARDALAALDVLTDWLPGAAAGSALGHARTFAAGCADAGISMPGATPRRPAGATLH